jgi:hypothetical protein
LCETRKTEATAVIDLDADILVGKLFWQERLSTLSANVAGRVERQQSERPDGHEAPSLQESGSLLVLKVRGATSAKRKLLVIAGAGSTLGDVGMPSVSEVHTLLLGFAQQCFTLQKDPSKNLYGYLYEVIERYWTANVPAHLSRLPNFEDILYAIYVLAATYPAGIFTAALGALVSIKPFPEVIHIGTPKKVDANVLRHLGEHLIDNMLNEFRRRCLAMPARFAEFQTFFSELGCEFDIAICTTNYDNLIFRAAPHGIETGFDSSKSGVFEAKRIIERKSWPCILHLHGSVHFDMDINKSDLHAICWKDNLSLPFHQNSFGRSSQHSVEGNVFPTSTIVAGYGKTTQIQRNPFRTYYSELDRIVSGCDAVLFLGYGFGDDHINNAFADFRDGRDRPVVVIDYADDKVMTAGTGFDESPTARKATQLFGASPRRLKAMGYSIPATVKGLKAVPDFERCTDRGSRLSLWYNGMLVACNYTPKVLAELA